VIIIDLYAGAGGWEEAGRPRSDAPAIGIETDRDCCATRAAAGHATVRADVTTYPLHHLPRVHGLIASPPCQAFSAAGKRDGIADLATIHARAHECLLAGWKENLEISWADERSRHVLEVLRWALQLVPEWIACEQVPDVLPVWEHFADVLHAQGWLTWCGILNAADYGVPQTRRRAFLLAHRRYEPVPPPATHTERPHPVLFGEEMRPWVSMADALGWGIEDPAWTLAGGCGPGGPDHLMQGGNGTRKAYALRLSRGRSQQRRDHPADEPSPVVSRGRSAEWIVNTRGDRRTPGGNEFTADAPSWALTSKTQWWDVRPATTVMADARIGEPGHRDRSTNGPAMFDGGLRLTERDALILQSFRPDYPLAGSYTSRFRQIGNAVPPVLAGVVLDTLTRCDGPQVVVA